MKFHQFRSSVTRVLQRRNRSSSSSSLLFRSETSRSYSQIHSEIERRSSFGIAFDIDGVIIRGHSPIGGSPKAIRRLYEDSGDLRIPFLFLTNGGGIPESRRALELSELLGVNVTPTQVVQGHSPFKELKNRFENELVVAVGKGEPAAVMSEYGFKKVLSIDEYASYFDNIDPLSQFKNWQIKNESSKNSNNSKKIVTTSVKAAFVVSDSVDWSRDIQVLCDILRTGGLPGREIGHQPPLYFASDDLEYQAAFPSERLGMGAFRIALEAVFNRTHHYPLEYTSFGKPNPFVFKNAETILKQLQSSSSHAHHAVNNGDSGCHPFKTLYMVGDNPAVDIKGARQAGTPWFSILTRTGVFKGKENHAEFPADLATIYYIDEVILEWAPYRSDGFDKDEVVLEGLQPHPNLKRLKISSFMGEKLPTWLNSCIFRFLPNLVEIELFCLERCEQLSGLGQLPSLKQLTLNGMNNLRRWEEEEASSTTTTTTTTNEKSLFPCLEKLTILSCTNLRTTPALFPSLKHLDVLNINVMLVRSLVNNHHLILSLTSLCIEGISELKFLPRDLLQPKLHSLEITNCSKFQGFVQNEEDEDEKCSFFDASSSSYLRERLTSLTKLIIHYEEQEESERCFSLVALGCLTSLKELEIRGCFTSFEELEIRGCFYAPSSSSSSSSSSREEGNIIQQQQQQQEEQNCCFRSLRKLVIDGCYILESLPQQIQYLTKLQELAIHNMVDMVALPDWVGNLSLLQKLTISNCFGLTHLQSEQVMRRLTSLEELRIYGVVSETANSFPAEGIQHLVSLCQLTISGSSNLNITSLPEQIQHLTSLWWLSLRGFNGLLELPEWLGNLSSLSYLWIKDCENLKYLPSEEAMKRLTKLSFLQIRGCPLLVKRCKEEETGEEWHKISHIKEVDFFN